MYKLQKTDIFLISLLTFTIVTTTTITIQPVLAGVSMGDVTGGLSKAKDKFEENTGINPDPGDILEKPGQILTNPEQAAKGWSEDMCSDITKFNIGNAFLTGDQIRNKCLEIFKNSLNFDFSIPFTIPTPKSIGGQIDLKGNALELKDTDVNIRILGIDVPKTLPTDYTITESQEPSLTTIIADILPEISPVIKKINDIGKIVEEVNKISNDIIDTKGVAFKDVLLPWTFTATFPIPEEIKNLNSIDPKSIFPGPTNAAELKEKLKNMKPIITFQIGYCLLEIDEKSCQFGEMYGEMFSYPNSDPETTSSVDSVSETTNDDWSDSTTTDSTSSDDLS